VVERRNERTEGEEGKGEEQEYRTGTGREKSSGKKMKAGQIAATC